jgi:hypothetical protein
MTVSPDKSARISKSRYFENAISNKEGARNKKALLQNRKGSRPLTATERKAKELFTDTRMPEVVRVAYSTRIPLTELSGGQKFRGRIISVTE